MGLNKYWHADKYCEKGCEFIVIIYLIITEPLTEQHGVGLFLISTAEIVLKMLPETKAPICIPISNFNSKLEKSYLAEKKTSETVEEAAYEE